MRKFVFLLSLTAFVAAGFAQAPPSSRGKEFYGMVMQNSGSSSIADSSFFDVFLSSPFAAHVTVQITDGSFSQNVTLTPNIVSTVSLPLSSEVTRRETVTEQAIHVVADTDISVYIIYHKPYSSDSYMALPVTALGTQYTAVCYTSCTNSSYFAGDYKASEFGIVATEDNTVVTITPSDRTDNGYDKGESFNVTLNKGQTYLVYGIAKQNVANDLTGSSVIATKPIAFLSGHDRTEIVHGNGFGTGGQSRNCLVEQIPPNNTFGTSFITVPFAGRAGPVDDYFRIVAPIDSTQILLNGSLVATINAGEFYEFHTATPTQVQTNNPVVLAQYSQSETDGRGQYSGLNPFSTFPWDPAMTIIPPTQQFLNDYIFANVIDAAFTANYVNIIIQDSGTSSVLLDGGAVPVSFISIAGSGYSYAQIPVSQGSHHITANFPFGIYIYGCGPADGYASAGGASFKFLNGLTVSSNIINYGNVALDSCRDTAVVFRNVGTTAITVWNITLSGVGVSDFSVVSGTPPFTIQPGDSQSVVVKFCPSTLGGTDSVQMNVSSNAAEHPIVTLLGTGLAGKLASATSTLNCDTARDDYGYKTLDCTRDTSFVIKNVSNAIVQVDSIGIGGTDAGDFTITSNTSFSLQPGDSITIVIEFHPTTDGVKNATLQTYSNAIANVQIALQGIGVSARIAGLPDTIDFGTVEVSHTKDSVLVIKNTSAFPAELVWGATVGDYYGLTGADAGNFGYLPHNSASPNALVILPGDSLVLRVSFTPLSNGAKLSEMIGAIPICHDSGAYNTGHIAYLKGNGEYATLGINPPIVDYKHVKLGKHKDSTLVLKNIGIYTANITQYAISGTDAQDFILMTATHPDSLTVGSDSSIAVRFEPLSLGEKHAQLVVSSGDVAGGSALADLYGEGVPATYNVITKTDTIHGRAGDVIQVPVHLLTPLDLADINKYHVVMQYDPTMLYATGVGADQTWSASQFQPVLTYVPGMSDVMALSPDSTLIGTGTLFNISMNVLLGDAQQTPLDLQIVTYTDNTSDSTAVTSAVEQGLFILDGYCGQPSSLLKTTSSTKVSSISPNPITGPAMVSYQVGQDGHVELGLYDELGNEVMQLLNADQKAGGYAVSLNAGNLPEGAYVLELRTGSLRAIKQVVVMK